MQGRTRIIILVVFVVIIVSLGGVFLMMQDGDSTQGGNSGQEQPPVGETAAVAEVTPTEDVDPFVPVVVAIRGISRGSKLEPGDLGIYWYPLEAVGENYIAGREPAYYRSNTSVNDAGQYIFTDDIDQTLINSAVGRLARNEIFAGQPIVESLLVEGVNDLADVGSDIAALIPEGLKAIAVPIDRFSSVAYAIQPGDRIDIIGMFYFVELDEEFSSALPNNISLINSIMDEETGTLVVSIDPNDLRGRFESERIPMINVAGGVIRQVPVDWPVLIRPSEKPRPGLAVQTLIQNALVVYVGEVPQDGNLFKTQEEPVVVEAAEEEVPQNANNAAQVPTPTPLDPRPDMAIIALSPQDANTATWIMASGIPVVYTLRSAQDTSQPVLQQVTLDYILNQYNIAVPEKQLYDVEGESVREVIQTFLDRGTSGQTAGETTSGQ